MQFRVVPAMAVFMGSYFPLALILALQDITQASWTAGACQSISNCSLPQLANPAMSLSGVALTGICLVLTFLILQKLRYKYPIRVLESKPVPTELISYSFPYIVSFMGVDYGSAGKIAGLIAFLAWLFLITYRAGQIIMNPILLIIGWNLYEVKININGHERLTKLLSRSCPTPGNYKCQEVQGSYITKGNPTHE